MQSFADELIGQIKAKKSIICVGLDPRIGSKSAIPQYLVDQHNHNANDAILDFNQQIVDATFDLTPVYKPQIAFYEQYNSLDALKDTIAYIHDKGGLVILDAKRNDIGSTCTAYAVNVFDFLKADAVTINSYFGIDGVKPFLKYINSGKGIITLIKTSNKSSGEFQDLFSLGLPKITPNQSFVSFNDLPNDAKLYRNYIHMARLLQSWVDSEDIMDEYKYGSFGYSSLGGVVGATYPDQMKSIRAEIPNSFILIPGYGAQGGTAADIVYGVNSDGLGAVVNASRSIDFAYENPEYGCSTTDFAEASRKSAKAMVEDINNALKQQNRLAY